MNQGALQVFTTGGREYLRVRSRNLTDYVDYSKAHRDVGINVARSMGFEDNNLDFLTQIPHVRAVHLQDKFESIRGLYALTKLEELYTPAQDHLDLSKFPELVRIGCEWSQTLKGLQELRRLRSLRVRRYRDKHQSVVNLGPPACLSELELIEGNVSSLGGLGNACPTLNTIRLSYLRQLEDIGELSRFKGLKVLEVTACPRAVDVTVLTKLAAVERLSIIDCKTLSSLSFVKHLPELTFISFVGTTVADGDLTPLLKHPKLRFAGFLDKRGYSHRAADIEAVLKTRLAAANDD